MGLAASAQAQTVIDFDSVDYAKIGVYDSWAGSPFRVDSATGKAKLEGNFQIIPNFLKETVDPILNRVVNTSDKIVGFQRSRYGSNLYGLRIDLKKPIDLTMANQYIHVMTYMPSKPTPSKMMVIGLGNHTDSAWTWQTGEDEQFWALSTNSVEASNKWQDVVVSFKGYQDINDDKTLGKSVIQIKSLVIIPDVATRSDMAEDFVCYFDSIVVDNSPAKRFSSDYYAVSFDKVSKPSRTDRLLNGVAISVNGTEQSANGMGNLSYNDNTTTTVFTVKPGDVVTPKFNYKGTWMSGYAYVDWGKDGVFDTSLNDNGTPTDSSDVVSYNALQFGDTWRKSDGSTTGNGNTIGQAMPTFTVPASANGFYRMRFKVDWNCIDAAGNAAENNTLRGNGGGIVDVILNVQAANEVVVSQGQLNGDVAIGNGTKIDNYKATAQQPLEILAQPAPQFHIQTLTVRYGFNTGDEEQLDNYGNPKYLVKQYKASEFNQEDKLTLPASVMIGSNVKLEAFFEQGGKPVLGDTLKTLDNLNDSSTYLIVNKSGGGYLCYNEDVSSENLSITGITGDASATHGLPAEEGVKAAYTKALDYFSANNCWTITKDEEGLYYLYNVGHKAYVFRNSTGDDVRTYKFTEDKTALTGIKSNPGYTYSFLSGEATYSDASTNFLCISSNNNPNPVVQWKWDDAGSEFFIISNPNVSPSGVMTGIETIAPVQVVDNRVYDLSGRRLNGKPARGLYIQGGKKFVVK